MNSIFTEENLLAFTTAARFGSFSKAAAELGVTTSAISYTIKRMETGLDVVLFVRSTRSIELTASGFYFYRKAVSLSLIRFIALSVASGYFRMVRNRYQPCFP